MMNTRIMNSMSSIIQNIFLLLWLLFKKELISSLAIFQMFFFCYVYKFLMFIQPAQRPSDATKQQNCKHGRGTLAH